MSEAARAFFAIRIPPLMANELEAAARTIDPALARPVPAEKMHLTLRFFASASRRQIALIKDAAERVTQRHPTINLQLGDLRAFPTGKPTVVAAQVRESTALGQLAHDLELVARSAAFQPERRRFRPHVTVARLRTRAAFELETLSYSGAFEVRQVALLQSRLTPDGPIYRELHTAKLLDR